MTEIVQIHLFRKTRTLSAELAEQIVKDASNFAVWSYDYRIAQSRQIILNPTAVDPILTPGEVIRLRFALATHLQLIGRGKDAWAEFRDACEMLDRQAWSDDIHIPIVKRLRFLYAMGHLEEALHYSHGAAVERVRQSQLDSGVRVSESVKVIDLRSKLDVLCGGPEAVDSILSQKPAVLIGAHSLGEADEWQMHLLFCELAIFHSEDGRQQALVQASGLAAVLYNWLMSHAYIRAGDKQLFVENQLMFFQVNQTIATVIAHSPRSRALIESLVAVAKWCRKVMNDLDMLPLKERVWYPAFEWVRVEWHAATLLLLAAIEDKQAQEEIRQQRVFDRPENVLWLMRLWPHRRLRVLHQRIRATDFAEGNTTNDVRRFIETVAEWRGKAGKFDYRSGLRRTLAWICVDVLESQRHWSLRIHNKTQHSGVQLLAEAEDVLGPARWLQEKIVASNNSSKVTSEVFVRYANLAQIFREGGSIVQVLPVGDDLYFIQTQINQDGHASSTSHPVIMGAHRRLRELVVWYRGETERVHRHLKLALVNGWDNTFLYEKLANATRECVRELGEVFARRLIVTDQADVLIACADPELLSLPWSLMEMSGQPLIERVRSLTFNVSVGAAAALQRPQSCNGKFDIAAYCHDTDHNGENALKWERMFFDPNGTAERLSDLKNSHRASLRTVGIKGLDDEIATITMLNAYSMAECSVLLVAGHGNPASKKGIWLLNGWWNPERLLGENWRLSKTECAVLPSCRLGEMQWDQPNGSGEHDPSKSEITGFTAGLCASGIPRVLACPWVAYDLPVCRLIPEVIERASVKRAAGEPHHWARALRDTVVDNLDPKNQVDFGLYDLANLMLFGAP